MEIYQVTEQTIITYYIVDCLLIVYGSIYITFFLKHIYMYHFWYGLYIVCRILILFTITYKNISIRFVTECLWKHVGCIGR